MNGIQQRPLDALDKSRDQSIVVEVRDNKRYRGILKAFDLNINIVLEDAEELEDGDLVRKLGTIFIKGSSVVLILTN